MRFRCSLLLIASVLLVGCSRVPPSFSGVLVSNWATDDKGSIEAKGRGTVWYNPFTQDLYIFPLHIQRTTYENEQAISVRSKENIEVMLSVGHAYRFEESKVAPIFVKYRTDPETLATGVIRDAVRNAFVKAASEYSTMELIGSKLTEMQGKALENLKQRMVPEGIVSDQLYVIGKPGIDQKVQDSINRVIDMVQQADRAEQEVRKIKAEAQQKIEAARGIAESTLLQAEADAKAAELLNQKLTPMVLQSNAINKWNGVMPTVSGSGAMPFINVGPK